MTSDGPSRPPDSTGVGTTSSQRVIVEAKDTVGYLVAGMPMVASTPYMVSIAERTCLEMAKALIAPGQVTVGSRVVIDHLGPSKVGATLAIEATLQKRDRNRFHFDVHIRDGDREVARVEHVRAAVSLDKLLAALA
jgi:fluoroacetyl-CoA thioesterase